MKKLSVHYVHHVLVYELPQSSSCGENQEGTLFSGLHICYAHLASVGFEHFVLCGSLMTTYGYIWFLHVLLIV